MEQAPTKRQLRCAIYSRVSTSRDQSPEAQIAELHKFCEARGWMVVRELTDHGYSGGTDARPAFRELIELARTRQIDVIVVTKLDRLFRSLRHLVTCLEELHSLGITFTATRDAIDWSTPSGRMFTQVLGALGEFERSLIRERTVAGLAHAKAKGKQLGRPRRGLEAEIKRLRAAGNTYRSIRQQLKCGAGTIRRALGDDPKTPSNSGAEIPEKTES